MIAYNKTWLDALFLRENANQWHAEGLLSDDKREAIKRAYPVGFYKPNVFVRVGLAVFCSILLSSAVGLVALFFEPDSQMGFALFSLFLGLVGWCILEFVVIRSGKHYASGMDDVLLYASGGGIITGITALVFTESPSSLAVACLCLPFLVFAAVRYVDRLAAAASFYCLLLIVFFLFESRPDIGQIVLPFAGMALAAVVYYFVKKVSKDYGLRFWRNSFTVLELLALALFYASGNYFVIQNMGNTMFGMEKVPMAQFFWAFTFVVPVLYIFWGLRNKERAMLDIGIACVAVAVFTFRHYHEVMPLAWAATIAGAVLFAVAYFSIRYLQKNDNVFTYSEESKKTMLQEIEKQLIEQQIAGSANFAPQKGPQFGGGAFGGGGGGGDF